MQRAPMPVLINVLAELLDQLRNQVRPRRPMLAPANLDISRSPVASVSRDTLKGGPMKMKKMRWP